ncbi:MAG: amidohydrolase family protein [Thermomicrobiales bacterium]
MSTTITIQARAAQGLPFDDVLIIDAHAHLGSFPMIHAPFSDASGLLGSMNRIGIRTTCLSSSYAICSDYVRGNDEVAATVRAYPGRFLGYAVINPNYPEEIERELGRCLDDLGFWGVKLHPDIHRYPPDGPSYLRVYAYMNERGGVILSHAFGDVRLLDRLSATYPNVVFIQAHEGGAYDGRTPSPYVPLLRERENVYLDTTLSIVRAGAIERLVDDSGADRLLFATDVPFLDNAHQLGRITHARISEEDKRKILGVNMQRLLAR